MADSPKSKAFSNELLKTGQEAVNLLATIQIRTGTSKKWKIDIRFTVSALGIQQVNSLILPNTLLDQLMTTYLTILIHSAIDMGVIVEAKR